MNAEPFLPYSRPLVADADIEAVVDVLRSPMLSQGERLGVFEGAFAAAMGARHAVAASSGTAALHAMCAAAGLGEGDEVVVPALTFAGTANAVRYCGARPVFADIDPGTLCLDPAAVRRAVGPRTRAILTVDFAGHPSPYDELRALADQAGCLLLADAAHAPGARYRGRPVGSLADMTAFSLNPVKNLTAGEGGVVTTDDAEAAWRLGAFVRHGMTRDADRLEGTAPGPWYYEQQRLGFNYKLSELHAALGHSQLGHLERYNARRAAVATAYDAALPGLGLELPRAAAHVRSAWHLYVVRTPHRDALFEALRAAGLGVQVHYIPVPMHPDYRRHGHTMDGLGETARYYATALSLPCHPGMDDDDVARVVEAVRAAMTPLAGRPG